MSADYIVVVVCLLLLLLLMLGIFFLISFLIFRRIALDSARLIHTMHCRHIDAHDVTDMVINRLHGGRLYGILVLPVIPRVVQTGYLFIHGSASLQYVLRRR